MIKRIMDINENVFFKYTDSSSALNCGIYIMLSNKSNIYAVIFQEELWPILKLKVFFMI